MGIRALAEPVRRSPRDFVDAFFEKFLEGDEAKRKDTIAIFDKGVESFLFNLEERVAGKKQHTTPASPEKTSSGPVATSERQEKRQVVDVMYEMSKEERLGPGGLDPVEVFEALPKEMQDAFKEK